MTQAELEMLIKEYPLPEYIFNNEEGNSLPLLISPLSFDKHEVSYGPHNPDFFWSADNNPLYMFETDYNIYGLSEVDVDYRKININNILTNL